MVGWLRFGLKVEVRSGLIGVRLRIRNSAVKFRVRGWEMHYISRGPHKDL